MSDQLCPKCGEPQKDGNRRCEHCGALIGGFSSWYERRSPLALLIVGLVLLLPGGCTVIFGAIGFGSADSIWLPLNIIAVGIVPAIVGALLLTVAYKRYRK